MAFSTKDIVGKNIFIFDLHHKNEDKDKRHMRIVLEPRDVLHWDLYALRAVNVKAKWIPDGKSDKVNQFLEREAGCVTVELAYTVPEEIERPHHFNDKCVYPKDGFVEVRPMDGTDKSVVRFKLTTGNLTMAPLEAMPRYKTKSEDSKKAKIEKTEESPKTEEPEKTKKAEKKKTEK